MSDQGNRSMQQGTNAARRAGRGAVKTGKTAYKAGKTFFKLPTPVKIGIAVALVLVLLFGVIVGGSSSTSMDETWYLTAENGKDKDQPANAPQTEEELTSVKSKYNSIKQTAELAQIIEEAKREDRAAIEAQIQKTYGDKNITIECDTDTEEYYISDLYSIGSGAGGSAAGTGQNAGALAVKWAIEKANESKQGKWVYVYYGKSGTGDNGVKKSTSCPICKPGSASPGWQCIGFVTAAYFHGAGVPSDIHKSTKYCHMAGFGTGGNGSNGTLDGANPEEVYKKWKLRNGDNWQMISTGSLKKGKLKDSELQAGDILLCYEKGKICHMAMYAGDGKVVESSGGKMNGGKGGIYHHKGKWTRNRARVAMRYTGAASSGASGGAAAGAATTAAGATTEGQKIVETALKYVGKVPYKHGGSSLETGCDCTGFVVQIYKKCGHKKFNAHFGSKGTSIGTDINKALPGDVIKYNHHWAIYAGNKKVVHCTGGYGVCVMNYKKPQGGSGVKDIRRYISSNAAPAMKEYKKLTTLKTLTASTGTIVNVTPASGHTFQSFAIGGNDIYLQSINTGARGSNGYIFKCGPDGKVTAKSGYMTLGHGNGLAYCTKNSTLYSVTINGIGNNRKAIKINAGTLKSAGSKSLEHGTSSIAYDRATNRFITSSGSQNGSPRSPGYLYVYKSNLRKLTGAKSIKKLRWKTPGDIAAYAGIVYVTVFSGGRNYIDMYSEETGGYLGTYEAPYAEIEGIDIDANGQIVLLFHAVQDFLQFTGLKASSLSTFSDDAGSALDGTTGISKSDLEVLSAYSISLANSELVFDKKAKKSKDKNIKDAIFGRYFNKEESKKGAKNGKPVKLYWFGKDRGKVNYPKDLKPKVKDAEFYSRDYEVSESGDSVKVTLKTRKAHELMKDMFDISPDDEYVNAKRAGLELNTKSKVSKMSTNGETTYSLAENTGQLLFDGKTVVRSSVAAGGGESGFGLFAGGTMNFPLNPKGVVVYSPFAWRWGRQHEGIDLSGGGGNEGKPIYAAAAGKVTRACWYSGYGNCVDIDHGSGLSTRYGHQSRLVVKQGDQVQAGQLIGYVGNTGHSFGAHLHFEVRINGKAVNPAPYIGIKNKTGYKCDIKGF